MCGIVGILFAYNEVQNFNILMSCLKELQNRGYDSMGVSIIDEPNIKFLIDKKIGNDIDLFKDQVLPFKNFIGHTRWATHGGVTIENAHPHIDSILGKFSMIHNGIIENYLEIKKLVTSQNIRLKSETDSEIFLNLIVLEYKKLDKYTTLCDEERIKKAVLQAVQKVEGTYGIVIQNLDHPEALFCIRKGSPLLIGTDSKQSTLIITSEKQAFPSFISKYIRLQSDELVVCKFDNHVLTREFISFGHSFQVMEESSLQNFSFYTEKEIYDQKNLLQKVSKFGSRLKSTHVKLGGFDTLKETLKSIKNVYFFGCGTSYHACLLLQHLFLEYTDFDIVLAFDASDFNSIYLPKILNKEHCGIFISQSGETRDLIKIHNDISQNFCTLGITNVIDSYLSTVTDAGLYTNIGKEKGVASTKSFTAQVVSGIFILLWFLQNKNKIALNLITPLLTIDSILETFISDTFIYCQERIVDKIYRFEKMFIMGRGKDYFIAKEGALKIKEIAYRCAEAYSTAALKHGPFALLTQDYLVIFILSDDSDENVKKVMNSVQEVHARGSSILLIATQKIKDTYVSLYEETHVFFITIPNHTLGFLFSSIVLQILAYQLSIKSGINPDFPRNLAKVVTVE